MANKRVLDPCCGSRGITMDVREKLIEILENSFEKQYEKRGLLTAPHTASDLIANGVTVQEWYSSSNPPKEDGTYIVQTNTGTITTARFYAFKSFPATKYLPAVHRHESWQ